MSFTGDAPFLEGPQWFITSPAIIYYAPESSGWAATYAGLPTVMWDASLSSAQVEADKLVLRISGSSGVEVKIEKTPSLIDPQWRGVGIVLIQNGTATFADPGLRAVPIAAYRLRTP
jgi:hypothetical protein